MNRNIGPCLCGDPYCSSCGDPGAAAREDWVCHIDELTEKFSEYECKLFETVGLAAVAVYREEQEMIRALRATAEEWLQP